jgi:hypothetical protein
MISLVESPRTGTCPSGCVGGHYDELLRCGCGSCSSPG